MNNKMKYIAVIPFLATILCGCNNNSDKDFGNTVDPYLFDDGETLRYGLYPQDVVNEDNEDLISSLNNSEVQSNGLVVFEGKYYVQAKATPMQSSAKRFDNGYTIYEGSSYWFECQPIEWDILEVNDGEYKLVSSKILDVCTYATSDNKYENSNIRDFLNNKFFNSAFFLNDSYLVETAIDEIGEAKDKVSLLTYTDLTNTQYGFTTDEGENNARYAKTSDYARTIGCYAENLSTLAFNGCYWTKTPCDNTHPNSAWIAGPKGTLDECLVNKTYIGVRPSITIKF